MDANLVVGPFFGSDSVFPGPRTLTFWCVHGAWPTCFSARILLSFRVPSELLCFSHERAFHDGSFSKHLWSLLISWHPIRSRTSSFFPSLDLVSLTVENTYPWLQGDPFFGVSHVFVFVTNYLCLLCVLCIYVIRSRPFGSTCGDRFSTHQLEGVRVPWDVYATLSYSKKPSYQRTRYCNFCLLLLNRVHSLIY